MIAGAQTAPIPYYAGAPVAERDLLTDANVLALMFEVQRVKQHIGPRTLLRIIVQVRLEMISL